MADNYTAGLDFWANNSDNHPANPARRAIAVTPSDTLDVTNAAGDGARGYAKGLYIGVTGNVVVIAAGDNTNSGAGTPVTFTAHPVGYIPLQVRRVKATGTSATNIVALYDA